MATRGSVLVTVPYGLVNGDEAGVVQVDAVAPDGRTAQGIGVQLVEAWLRLSHPDTGYRASTTRVRAGAPRDGIDGAYAYVLSRRERIHHITIARRVDGNGGELLAQTLAGLDAHETYAVVFDLAGLDYVNTIGLAALVASSKRLRLLVAAASPTVREVFDAIGVSRLLPMHATVIAALDTLR